ncbi:hypothetical protein GCM10009037_11370 [Halarchaeum grantii]|uniref:DUF4382 domain-containing protein n=1 Tax=Halarchaeum grantii TaxID=1193105 RepID=A0A830F178_9EURY|nr:DUF4382 domain-containing protein [Halarchaeum grantii]GGL29437.1 hypothetical protein GCM10009037_11370 [Halarchaeum grantii]
MQRQSLLAIALVALVALAGCSTGPGGGGGANGETGTMTVYLSDQPGAIEQFDHLNVTVTSVGVHAVNDSDGGNESGEWIRQNVSGTYDLTELRGENATVLGALDLPNGTYNNVFVSVSNVNGTLDDGSHPAVKLPSNRLHVQKNFTVGAGEESHFVFDVMVHETGDGKYVLRPNVGESGVDKPVRETDARATRGSQGEQSDSEAPENRSEQGSVVTYVSDRPAAIDDFRHLNATVTEVGLHRAGGANGSTNTSAWQTVAVNETVDLTELRGANATPVVEQTVPNGTYDNVFVYVSNVNGTLDDGSHPAVKLPSGKLHLSTTFTVGSGETVDFVFDLAVHETGNGRYIVKPNAGESGPDQPIERVGGHDEADAEETTTTTSESTTTTTTAENTTTTTTSTTAGNASA